MLRIRSSRTAFQLAVFALSLGVCVATAAQPPDKLPLLPPPIKPKPAEPAPKAAEPAPNVTRIPVEFKIAIADLEKELLRSIVQKIDPKAEPVLPIVVAGNERKFELLAPDPKAEKADNAQKVEAPAMVPDMRPGRPRLLPRPRAGEPGIVGRLAARPLIAAVVTVVKGMMDLNYQIELRSFSLTVSGNVLTCEVGGGFHAEGKALQAAPGQPPLLPPNVRDVSVKLLVTKELVWGDDGKLELKGGTSNVWIDPEAPVIGFPLLNIERVIKLNGILDRLSGVLDRKLMERLQTDNLPDLAVIAPKVKVPFMAVSELTAYPLWADGKDLYVPLVVGLVPSNKKAADGVKVAVATGPAPEPKLRGRIVFDKDGKPDVKIDPKP